MTPPDWVTYAPYVKAINALKKERNAVILGHNYITPEIFHGVSDFVGDSLQIAMKAQEVDAEVIVQAGVHFMAETTKILCPEKTVLMPDMEAGCSLAESITADGIAVSVPEIPASPIEITFEEGGTPLDPEAVSQLRQTMTAHVGVVRDATGLKAALRKIAALEAANKACVSFLNMTATATLIAVSALNREESHGAHCRSDFPDTFSGDGQRSQLTLSEALAMPSQICKEAS